MYSMIEEGSVKAYVHTAEKISKELPVFYNPAMKFNRDISVLLLKQFPPMSLCDPLAGTGIRSIRLAKELKYKSIAINDINKKAVESIKNNLKFNKLNNNKKLKVYNDDTNLFLLNSKGFNYIDIDPFGSSNYYLDAAIKMISRNGILAVTNTDTAALTGTYPNACARKYWAVPKLDYLMHETGLRILIRKIQLVGMQYEKALFPIFSYFKDHYFRVFFRCVKGKRICDEIAERHGMLNDTGPLWLGSLWDSKLVNGMYTTLLKNNNEKIIINNNQNELLKFLKTIKDESKIDSIGFYDLHYIAEKKRLRTMGKKEDIIKKIKKNGYMASGTHFSGTGVRSNIPYAKLLPLLKR